MPYIKHALPEPACYYAGELDRFKENGYRGTSLCPFHMEKRPSFSVNLETGAYKCYSCGARGSGIVSFHMERYSKSFKEAAKELGAWR